MSDLGAKKATTKVSAPAVFPPYPVRQLVTLLFTSPQLVLSLLPLPSQGPPAWLRWFIYLTFILNLKSWPGSWHVQLFWPIVRTILKARPYIPLIRSSKDGQTTDAQTGRKLRWEALPLGKDIFEERSYVQMRATPDDCDYMFHLSNSAYLKNLDQARTRLVFPHFFRFYSEGGILMLGGSTLHHHREIAVGAKYEIRCEIASWDDKWFYLISYFTSPTDPATRSSNRRPEPTSSSQRSPGISLSRSARDLRELLSDVSRPEYEAKERERQKRSVTASPLAMSRRQSLSQSSNELGRSPSGDAAASASGAPKTTLYATVVSRYTPKYKRKTIPPWFVVATSGFGTWASTRSNWDRAEETRARYAIGLKRMQEKKEEIKGSSSGGGGGSGSTSKGKGKAKPTPKWEGMLKAFDPARAKAMKKESGSTKRYNDEDEEEQAQRRAESQGHGEAIAVSSSDIEGTSPSSKWMLPTSWSQTEWENRRRQGLARVQALGGLAAEKTVVDELVADVAVKQTQSN